MTGSGGHVTSRRASLATVPTKVVYKITYPNQGLHSVSSSTTDLEAQA